MPVSILSTKLYVPHPQPNCVLRPHLTARLLAGMERPGTWALVSGPAGFGKTTLLSEFIEQYRQPVAWLTLDGADNDPIRFWTHFIAACQSLEAGVGEAALGLFRSTQPAPEDAVPTILINDLAGREHKLVLVLDDYHVIQNPAIHSAVSFLLDHLPDNLHIIFSTRIDPPWPLARFRARSQLIEIRAADLRFTEAEAADFLSRTMELNLSQMEIASISTRTEGWIAGLQLAALSMRGRERYRQFRQGVYRQPCLRGRLPGRGSAAAPVGGNAGIPAADLHPGALERRSVRSRQRVPGWAGGADGTPPGEHVCPAIG